MKKLIFAVAAMACLVACNPGSAKVEKVEKCYDPDSIVYHILNDSVADTVRFDLNGDGVVDVSDVTIAINKNKEASDSSAVQSELDSKKVKSNVPEDVNKLAQTMLDSAKMVKK